MLAERTTQPLAGIACNLFAGIVVCGVARPSQDPAPAALSDKANDPAPLGGLAVMGETDTNQPLESGWHPQQLPPGIADGINHTARGQKPCAGFARIIPSMEATKLWASASEAAEVLGVSATRLRQLKASGDLLPGEHWVYLTGTQGGPVGWSVEQIRQWQIEKTKACVSNEQAKAASIETFEEVA